MSSRTRILLCVWAAGLLCLNASCDSLGGLLGAFGNNVRLIIENRTSYKAEPDIRTSDSRNLFEDIFGQGDQVTNFGDHGVVAARQTVTVYLSCDDLEHIAIGDVDFLDGDDDRVGTEDANASLRRDSDFDCGAVIRLTLDGGVFNFSADVDVEQDALGDDSNDRGSDDDDDNEDMADLLYRLFGH